MWENEAVASDRACVTELNDQSHDFELSAEQYDAFVETLKDELIPAMGCTEPIAVAYAAAVAVRTLGATPARCRTIVSGNIVKNVNSVIVPNTGGLRGIPASVAAGIVAGDPDAKLEVLAKANDEDRANIREFLSKHDIDVSIADTAEPFFIEIDVTDETGSTARVVMEHDHTHLTRIEKDGETIAVDEQEPIEDKIEKIREIFSLEAIIAFADTVVLDDVREPLERQISFNYAIAKEGLEHPWGSQIGRTLLSSYDADDVFVKAKAAAAAGSDARMNGCPMPVVIVSGSGNQGIAASVPLVVYAREMNADHEQLLRALVVSDLVSIYQKSGIGCLSAFCGAICAGTGATAGIAYLLGGRFRDIEHTVVNSLGIISGMVCDGAKSSCAAKIALALDSGMMGYRMYKNGQQFYSGDGIIAESVDATIANVSRMAREGMRETDREILDIMVGSNSHKERI